MGTVSGFLSVAGAALTGIGALTGKKDLMKIGGLMSLGGGLANMASAATTGGANAATSEAWATGAGRGGDVLSAAGGDAAGAATTAGANGMDQAMQLAQQNASNGVSYADALGQGGDGFGSSGAGGVGEANANSLWDKANPMNQTEQARFMEANTTDLPDSIVDKAMARAGLPSNATVGGQVVNTNPLEAGALRLDGNSVDAVLERSAARAAVANAQNGGVPSITLDSIGNGLNKLGQFAKNNKDLISIVGSNFGPQAESMDWQKSIMARRLRNMNNPVALSFGG